MGKKKKKKKRNEPAAAEAAESVSVSESGSGGGATRAIAIGLFVVGIGVVGYALISAPNEPALQSTVPTAASASTSDGKPAPYFDSVEDAKPFPVTLPPSQFENDVLKISYAIAKDIPEVLVQQPCLCGCNMQREGHGSLLDCFIDDHAST